MFVPVSSLQVHTEKKKDVVSDLRPHLASVPHKEIGTGAVVSGCHRENVHSSIMCGGMQ